MNHSELKRIAAMPPRKQQIVLAALVAAEFQKVNVILTVVGGAAVQFYTQAKYTTKDIDAILWGDSLEIVNRVMEDLGFHRTTTYRHFEHPSLPFVVEFPSSPIAVGNRLIEETNLIKIGKRSVRVITIEDLIMDRIIAAVEWKSPAHIEQAKLIWLKNKVRINIAYLTEFAKSEGYLDTLTTIMATA
jgi:predicted nucleotidyltransferase